MATDVRKTHSHLKGLAETRARADGDMRRLQQLLDEIDPMLAEAVRIQTIHAQVTAKLAAARAERDACDLLIRKFDDRGRSLVDLALASPPWLVKAMAVMLVLAAASYALAVAAKEARAWVALAAFATAAYFAHTWKIPTLVLALVSLIGYVRLGRKAL